MQKKAILKKQPRKSGVDGALITDRNNVRYLSGFTGSSGFLIITKGHSIFVTDFRYKEQAKIETKGCKIKIESSEKTDAVKKIADEYGIKKLGFEAHSVSYHIYRSLRRKGLKLRALTNTVGDMRLIKSRKELSCIKTAVRRAENAFRKLLPFIKPGTSEQKLAVRLEGLLKEEGCKILPFEVIVASGQRSALPHAKPTSRVIKKGDIILFDWGGESEGYYSDMTRMVAVKGRHTEKLLEIYSLVADARKRAIKSVRPGVKSRTIDSAARDLITQKGYGEYFGHGTGHGIGLEVHERPFISQQCKNTVEEGMVFTIEPGVYLPGLGGARIEDIVAVGKSGAEVLTSLSRRLKII